MNAASDEVARSALTPRSGHPIRGAGSPRRVLQALLAFSEENPNLTISNLAEVLGVPLSTCYRYIGLLREVGLVDEGERSTYHVTPRIMDVARAARAANPLAQYARPALARIQAEVNETVMLMQLFQTSVVCVESVASTQPIRLVFEPGFTIALDEGASGKLLLALLPESDRSTYLSRREAAEPAFAQRLPALRRELPQLAAQGWAINNPAVDDGIWACAAGITDFGQADATISVAGPAGRIAPADRERIRDLVVEAANEVTTMRAH
jgi:DNA-binding IclR family transcriptional regulator